MSDVEPRFLAEPPSTCRDTLDRQGWAVPPMAVAVGPYHLGVRPGDAALDARLRAALRTHVVAGLEPPANFSVRLAGPAAHRHGAGFHLLYRGCGLALRTRDPHRLVHGLVHHLDSFEPDYGAGCVALQGVALVGEGRGLIAPVSLRASLARVERRLNLRGLRFVDTPCVLLDPIRAEIVVPDFGLGVDWTAFDDLDTVAPGSRRDTPVPVGRYAVTGWTFLGNGEPLSRARAVALATRATIRTRAAQPTLDALASVMRRVEPTSIEWAGPAELAAALLARS